MPILAKDSPLALLPDALDLHQKHVLSGMRYAVEFVDVAYGRLRDALGQLSDTSKKAPREVRVAAMLDAWTVVDATHRLRTLVESLRGYKSRAASKQAFLRATEPVVGLRNAVQHLSSDVKALIDSGLPIMGALTWLSRESEVGQRYIVGALHTGALTDAAGLVPVVEVPERFEGTIGEVRLWAAGSSANLSGVVAAVARLATVLESRLRETFPNAASSMNDAICIAKITVSVEQDTDSPRDAA